ncbi:MAG: bleomycin resistance family protein [Woeseiaceae bacterium]
MKAEGLTPILNVSDINESFLWFEKLGWSRSLEWGDPVGFGSVRSGDYEIFLCLNGQGGRGKGDQAATFSEGSNESTDKGVWMSVWVNDVDEVYRECLDGDLDVAFKPTDMPWKVREMHVRHPDGHVFRVSSGIGEE